MPKISVTVVDAHELVIAGAAALLSLHPERVALADWSDFSKVDVVLYGVDDEARGHDERLHDLLRSSSATFIAFGWEEAGPGARLAARCGVHGFAHKRLPAGRLLDRIEFLRASRSDGLAVLPAAGQCHPGVETAGLTRRETEVLALIGSGYSNLEIASEFFISINSVKSYIRLIYRKIGVNRRAQAVIWARHHGLGAPLEEVTPIRTVDVPRPDASRSLSTAHLADLSMATGTG